MQDDEDVVVVRVELRALVARVDVLVVEGVEVEALLEPLAVGQSGLFDVDPAEACGLDDLRLGDVYLAGQQDTAGRDGTAKSRARERQGRHRLGGFIGRSGAILAPRGADSRHRTFVPKRSAPALAQGDRETSLHPWMPLGAAIGVMVAIKQPI